MGDWRKFAGLSWRDRRMLARATVMLVHTKLALSSTAFRAGGDQAQRAPDSATAAANLARAGTLARLVGIAAARVPFRVSCLHRSVVLWRLLSAEGIACELQLGARTGAGPFEAHAWVECQGVAVGEDAARRMRYRRFSRPVAPVRGSAGAPKAEAQRST